ncbi:hypothetical protein EJ03DRAFT_348212 [Teratosphaeria nubilosa]|uniref:DUF7730 domain-containing protein n=1 Tax=Teratosphaeria nubilosa TaxID=161662 RepID=A0A6G1LJZ0_9PEZI|nr:hypothetical protein EJ03DRAFT_348212 [Teratosphaeria nubilosa]
MKAIKDFVHRQKATKSPPTAFNDQSDCPIFTRFPREIRDTIWDYALSLRGNSRVVHFHIYNHVYNCCTYSGRSTEPPDASSELNRATGLLRTCKAIYEEAVPLLYKQVRFELVLFSGRVRPEVPNVLRGTKEESWKDSKIGKVKRCATFALMNDITIVLQPALYLDSRQYERRIASLLKALNFGQNASKLALIFNIPGPSDNITAAERWAASVVQALMPLAQYHGPKASNVAKPKPTRLYIVANTLDEIKYPRTRAAIEDLRIALGVSCLLIFNPSVMLRDARQMVMNECILRQHYADCPFHFQHNQQAAAPAPKLPRPKSERIFLCVLDVILWTAVMAAGPVVLPVLMLGDASIHVADRLSKKRLHGESWRMQMRARK